MEDVGGVIREGVPVLFHIVGEFEKGVAVLEAPLEKRRPVETPLGQIGGSLAGVAGLRLGLDPVVRLHRVFDS